ncbi:MAG: hypothetical protein WAS75_04160 [Candidatus Microthrix subdominans]|jgi:predicted nucleic acid-binding protein|nr:hypothetical protein [Candidatus Microthrix sp.]MBK9560294.1 hypothetical protein [Candidatus Microthrix sp.]
MLDTSAVLGWLERKTPGVSDAVRTAGATPLIHIATLAELHERVARAEAVGAASTEQRRQTVEFVLHRLGRTPAPSEIDAECFGCLSACTSRKLSHNDKWIVAASIIGGHRLLTEDARLHAQVMGNAELERTVVGRGWSSPQIVLTG